jgi:hypothetical protein
MRLLSYDGYFLRRVDGVVEHQEQWVLVLHGVQWQVWVLIWVLRLILEDGDVMLENLQVKGFCVLLDTGVKYLNRSKNNFFVLAGVLLPDVVFLRLVKMLAAVLLAVLLLLLT